ncbi:MucR family transcriptional regulator [Phenylobacterium sp. LjRoot219]
MADVAAAYFSNSHVTPTDIQTVINQIASSLSAVGTTPAVEASSPEAPEQIQLTPAQVRKSITRDALISFEDNKPYKTLRRHLAVRGLSAEQYREKWGLPKDYPMVAPSYSEARSKMAKALGLGARLNQARTPPPPAPPPAAPAKAAKGRRASPAAPRRGKAASKKAGEGA